MRKGKLLSEAGVLFIAAFLVLSTVVVANTSEELSAQEGISFATGTTQSAFEEETIGYYDPDTAGSTGIGLQGGTPPYTWKTAIRITQDELAPYLGNDWNLIAANILHIEEIEHWGRVVIAGEGTASTPGAEITAEDYHFDVAGWFRIDFTSPVPLDDHNEIWLIVEWETDDNDHPAAMDNIEAVDTKGDWLYMNSVWQECQVFGPDFDHNWCMEAIIEGEGTTFTELSIGDIVGPIGVSTTIDNVGENPATNVEYTMTVTGGILGMIDKEITGTVAELAIGGSEAVASGLIFGLGSIDIAVSATADNAEPVEKTASAFVLGPFVLNIS